MIIKTAIRNASGLSKYIRKIVFPTNFVRWRNVVKGKMVCDFANISNCVTDKGR